MEKTYSAKTGEVERKWFLVDLENEVLGRAATRIASILRGKHKPQFTPHIDTGDFVVVINADKVKLTGKKLQQKRYFWHTAFFGGIKSLTAEEALQRHPDWLIQKAVAGMLPKNTLGRHLIKKLKIFTGPTHEHEAQKPQKINLSEMR